VTSVKGDGEQRLTRQRIEKTLSHSKAIQVPYFWEDFMKGERFFEVFYFICFIYQLMIESTIHSFIYLFICLI